MSSLPMSCSRPTKKASEGVAPSLHAVSQRARDGGRAHTVLAHGLARALEIGKRRHGRHSTGQVGDRACTHSDNGILDRSAGHPRMKRHRIGHAKDASSQGGVLLDEIAHLLHPEVGARDASDSPSAPHRKRPQSLKLGQVSRQALRRLGVGDSRIILTKPQFLQHRCRQLHHGGHLSSVGRHRTNSGLELG